MTTHPMNPVRSEKGVALIIVLLLLAVMAGLTTGLTLNAQTEISMAHNETYYAGTRAAAEAGMNRAVEQIIGDTSTDLIATKAIPNIGNGPIDLNDEYSYTFQLLDDDDPLLYNGVALTLAQRTAMGAGQTPPTPEDGDPDNDTNSRMILRATATGPRGTTVTVARILSRFTIPAIPTVTTINPAILVNGLLDMTGNMTVGGAQGNVHANGDVTGGGSANIRGNLTATGSIAAGLDPDGLKAGGQSPIPVPQIKASDYIGLATHKLTSTGAKQVLVGGAWVACSGTGATSCPVGWTFSGGAWSASGSMPTSGVNKSTYYVEGSVSVQGTGKSTNHTFISIIAEGSIKITGNGKYKPGNDSKIQFVTNGDFELLGNADADDPTDLDGQIMVREQFSVTGNSEFQGRIMVEDRDSAANAYNASTNLNGRRNADVLSSNSLAGSMVVTYNGSLGGITVPNPPGAPTYTNIMSGWMEQ